MPLAQKPTLTVVMPACNEEGCLETSIRSLVRHIDRLKIDTEILIVDDQSEDNTYALAEGLAAGDARIRIVRHLARLGIGGGFLTGVREARGELVILIPADLPLDLAELPTYLEAAQQADIVVGVCRRHSDYSLFRRLVHEANILLVRWLFDMKLRQFQYICLYRMDVLRQFQIEYWHSAFFHAEILIKAADLGRRLVEVEVTGAPRSSGRATGARWGLIVRTLGDIGRFWIRWKWYDGKSRRKAA